MSRYCITAFQDVRPFLDPAGRGSAGYTPPRAWLILLQLSSIPGCITLDTSWKVKDQSCYITTSCALLSWLMRHHRLIHSVLLTICFLSSAVLADETSHHGSYFAADDYCQCTSTNLCTVCGCTVLCCGKMSTTLFSYQWDSK